MTQSPDIPSSSGRLSFRVWAILVLALALRLGLSFISYGTNDALIWVQLSQSIAAKGLLEAYRTEQLLNHPPLAALWGRLSLAIGGADWFTFVFKLPVIAADLLAVWLLARLRRPSLSAALAMALSPVAILLSGFHCNSDSIYALLSLLTACLIASGRRFFLAGLALGAAINIKLIPVLLIPAAFSFCRDRRELLRLLGGLAVAAIPFLPLLAVPEAVERNMLGYTSQLNRWGIPFFLLEARSVPRFAAGADTLLQVYSWLGRMLIIAAVLGASAASWWWRRWTPCQLFVLVYAIFLILAPGFGVQYTVIIVPLLLAIDRRAGWLYGILSGLFLGLIYWANLKTYMPLLAVFPTIVWPMPGPLFGLLAWWVLIRKTIDAGRSMVD